MIDERTRQTFMKMLKAAEDEADAKGTHSVQSVADEMDEIIGRDADQVPASQCRGGRSLPANR
jgi:hypothetical protein